MKKTEIWENIKTKLDYHSKSLTRDAELLVRKFYGKSYIGEKSALKIVSDDRFRRIISYFLRKKLINHGVGDEKEKHVYKFNAEMYDWFDERRASRSKRNIETFRVFLDITVIVILLFTFKMSSIEVQNMVQINKVNPSVTFGTKNHWTLTTGSETEFEIKGNKLNKTEVEIPFFLNVTNIGKPPIHLISLRYSSKCGVEKGNYGAVLFDHNVVTSGKTATAKGSVNLRHANPESRLMKEVLPCEVTLEAIGVNFRDQRKILVIDGSK